MNTNELSLEQRNYIIENLQQKGLDTETIETALEFCEVSNKAFSNVENIDELIKEMVHKINENIEYAKTITIGDETINIGRGIYLHESRKIVLPPKMKGKKNARIVKFHELQHCKDTEEIKMSPDEVNQKRKQAIEKIKNPKQKKYLEYGLDRYIQESQGIFYMSGVHEPLNSYAKWGTSLKFFVEGVTTYKQRKFEQLMGIKKEAVYQDEVRLVETVCQLIGEEEFLSHYNNHDFESIRNLVLEKTQGKIQLEDTVDLLNEVTLQETRNMFHFKEATKYRKQLKIMKLIAKCREKGIYVSPEQVNIRNLKKLLRQKAVPVLEEPKSDFLRQRMKFMNELNNISNFENEMSKKQDEVYYKLPEVTDKEEKDNWKSGWIH